MSIVWNAVSALATLAAAVAALYLGLRAERRAEAESKAADRRLDAQLEAQRDGRRRELVVDRLLQLMDSYATWQAMKDAPQGAEAAARMRVLLRSLPLGYATFLRGASSTSTSCRSTGWSGRST